MKSRWATPQKKVKPETRKYKTLNYNDQSQLNAIFNRLKMYQEVLYSAQNAKERKVTRDIAQRVATIILKKLIFSII